MFARSARFSVRPVVRIPFKPQTSLPHRYYATGNGSGNGNGSRINHFIPITVLGLAAVGLTYYNMNNNTKPPTAAIDPTSNTIVSKGPLFPSKTHEDPINVVFVLGGPGSGKGTQCAKLVADYGFIHLSAGDLLRKEQATPGSEFGELIHHYIKEGLIVPQEITIGLLKNAIEEDYLKGSRNFLVDGFPRKMDQALSFENIVSEGKLVLYFECPEEVMLKRLLNRGKTSGRADDNLESIKKRFRTFVETSMPVVDYYADHDKVVKVSCNQPVEEVYQHVVEQFKEKKII
jgi:UMP-CMP kinase